MKTKNIIQHINSTLALIADIDEVLSKLADNKLGLEYRQYAHLKDKHIQELQELMRQNTKPLKVVLRHERKRAAS
jgi:hypothetical protein